MRNIKGLLSDYLWIVVFWAMFAAFGAYVVNYSDAGIRRGTHSVPVTLISNDTFVDPTSISNLVFWLDAADSSTLTLTGSRVDGWADKSGNGNDFGTGHAGTGFNPDYNAGYFGGVGGLNFHNSNDFLDSDATIDYDHRYTTTFVVYNQNNSTRDMNWLIYDVGAGILDAGSGFGRRLGFATGGNVIDAYGFPTQTPVILIARNDNGTQYLGLNNEIHAATQMTGTTTAGANGLIQINGIQPGGSSRGRMGAALLYDRALSDAEVIQVANYLASRYNVTQAHNSTYNIVMEGDSIAAGFWGDNNGTTFLDALDDLGIDTRDTFMAATSAQTAEGARDSGDTRVDVWYDTGVAAKNRVAILWAGTNDLAGGKTPAQLKGYIQEWCEDRTAAGWRVVVGTILPRSNGGLHADYETSRQEVNQWLRDNYQNFANALADVASDTDIGENGDSDNTTYYNADKIHLKDAGHNVAHAYFETAITVATTD